MFEFNGYSSVSLHGTKAPLRPSFCNSTKLSTALGKLLGGSYAEAVAAYSPDTAACLADALVASHAPSTVKRLVLMQSPFNIRPKRGLCRVVGAGQ